MRKTAQVTRERIVQATLHLIGEEGLGAVTNRTVARAAGVSLGTLTYHFPNQSDLLRETLQTFVETEITRATARANRLQDATPDQAADEVEKAILEFTDNTEQIANLELHLQAARDPALQATATRAIAAYDHLAAAILTTLGIPNAADHAPKVVAMLYGLAIRRLATGDTTATGTAESLRLLLRGITASD